MAERCAAIDVGSNCVQAVAAERRPDGSWQVLLERELITRLGRGVDRTGALAAEAIADTVAAVGQCLAEARVKGVSRFAAVATSAARDATNREAFLAEVRDRAGLEIEVISGEQEAALTYAGVAGAFGDLDSLGVIDIGGGSTEVVVGQRGVVSFQRSHQIGTVRLTERCALRPPLSLEARGAAETAAREAFATLPRREGPWVAVAATATTLARRVHRRAPEEGDAVEVHALRDCVDTLCAMPLSALRAMPGVAAGRADVLPAGGLILLAAMEATGAQSVRVSERGLRWGLLRERFG